MGLTEEEFNARTSQDVDELLAEIELSRRQELLEQLPFERVLTKEDCLQMFRVNGHPTTGPMLGVWRWAADLGHARFNFETEPVGDDYSFLNAYD